MQKNVEVAEIINKHLKKSPFSNLISIDKDNISYNENLETISWRVSIVGNLVQYDDELAKLITQILTKDRRFDYGEFFHFKKLEHTFSILKNQEIQLSALSSHISNDSAEYSEFLHRYNYNNAFNDEHIEEAKNNIYIYCFTHHFRNQRFWDEYIRDESGVCIGFRFEDFKIDLSAQYSLVDVIYDEGYNFDFVNDIQREIKNKFNKTLSIGGMNRIARYYKRTRYSWELETRLLFDFSENKKFLTSFFGSGLTKLDLTKYIKQEFDEIRNRHYIRLKFDNPFFKIKICEIICGKNISDKQINEIKSLVSNDVKVWRLSDYEI